jgi:hypothetical protein
MPNQTELKSTGRKRRKECYGNGKQLQMEKIDNPWLETLMTTLAVIQQYHPNGDESSEESNEEEEEQIDHTVLKAFFFINTKLSSFLCRLVQTNINRWEKIVDDKLEQLICLLINGNYQGI